MSENREYRTQVRRWFVETGYVDCNGIGLWDGTVESVEVQSEKEAEALRDKWLADGILKRTNWGELRANFDYGAFRIRSTWEDVTDLHDALRAENERLREALVQIAWNDDPNHDCPSIARAALKTKGTQDE